MEGRHWKKVLVPAGPLRWDCGPTVRSFCRRGTPTQIATQCSEVPEFDGEFCEAMVSLKVPGARAFFPGDVARVAPRACKRKRGLSSEGYKDLAGDLNGTPHTFRCSRDVLRLPAYLVPPMRALQYSTVFHSIVAVQVHIFNISSVCEFRCFSNAQLTSVCSVVSTNPHALILFGSH
ncbi:unnamed protein product [Prorocentrum cordatum]|uniref:Uncharacterized protein n=1 Tax=Prorocentrum cordatum TaxID=2364126 RepID=A0ABN9WSY9_9DINO|nr:unnamed protein product [Polarella glacialis]